MKKIILLLFFFCLFSVSVFAARSSDFEKITVGDIEYFTTKDMNTSDYVVGSDKIFYGSKNGNVRLKIFLSEKEAIGTRNFRIGVRSHGELIKITEVSVDGDSTIIQNAKFEQDFIFQPFINLGKDIEEIEIELEFDPLDVWIREEIDIVLYDQFGNIVAVYDPFISGFNFRLEGTIDTISLLLSTDLDTNHSLLARIDSSNPFWTSETCGDGTGITFAQSDEITELDFDPESFDFGTNDANIWFEETEQFQSATNGTFFFYYDGVCVDNSDGTGAYPSSIIAGWHLNDSSSPAQDFTINNFDLTHANTPTLQADAQIDGGVSYASASSEKSTNTTFLDGGISDMSFSVWFNRASAQTNFAGLISKVNSSGVEEPIRLRWDSGGALNWFLRENSQDSSILTTKTSWDANTWFNLIGTRNATTGELKLYLDGLLDATIAGSAGSIASGTGENFRLAEGSADVIFFNGIIDETKFFDIILTSNDVNIIYASENETLITFGAEETSAQPPDINVTSPNATGTQIKGGDVFSITFDVQDPDTNSLLIDLNFSSSSSQGTGTIIINDVNTDSATITCDDSDFSNSTNCFFSWTTPTLDANFFMLASATDGVSALAFDAGDNNFMIDSTPPVFLTILPDVNFTKEAFNLDFNLTMDDGVGSGNFRCITRVFFDGVLQGGLDLNVDGSTGTCIRSISSGVPDDTNVSVGFRTVDNVGNVSDENVSQLIFFSPPITTIPPLSIVGTGECVVDLTTNFYLGQYLQITLSGFNDDGNLLTSSQFDLFRGEEQVITDQNLTLVDNLLTFILNKKINDDPYTLQVISGNCISTKLIQVKFN